MDSAAPAPLAPFETIRRADPRARAGAAARSRALVQGDEALDYGALDALMDRVAASLQRDGVQPGDCDRDLRADLAALRGGVPRRAARRRRGRAAGAVGDAAELRVDARRCAGAAAVRRLVGARRCCGAGRAGRAARRARRRARPAPRSTTGWCRPAQRPQPVDVAARVAVQHHLFVAARPARPRASCSRTACAGRTSSAARPTATARRPSRCCRRRSTRTPRWWCSSRRSRSAAPWC